MSFKVQRVDFGFDDLDEQEVISLLTDVIEKVKKENEELYIKQTNIQVTWKSSWLNSDFKKCKCSELKVKMFLMFLLFSTRPTRTTWKCY